MLQQLVAKAVQNKKEKNEKLFDIIFGRKNSRSSTTALKPSRYWCVGGKY